MNLKESLVKYKVSLLELKRANARRSSKAMAVVLGESFNKAVDRFSLSPTGLSGWFALGVIVSWRDQPCLQNNALIANQPESQRRFRLNQRFLNCQITKQSGVAIITVVLIIAIMATLLSFMIESQHLLMRRITNQIITEQAYQVTMGSEILGIAVLEKDVRLPNETDHLGEDWNKLYVEEGVEIDQGRGQLITKVIDLQGRFNLNNVSNTNTATPDSGYQQFKKLLEILDVPDADVLANTLTDWMDENDLHRLNSAEQPEYNGLTPAYYASDQRLVSVGELKYVKGFTSEVISALAEHVTVLPEDNIKININTCGAEQIRLLGATSVSISEPLARDFADNRPPEGYATVEDALNALALFGVGAINPAAKNMVTVKSDYFEVQSEAKYGDLTYRMNSQLKREGKDPIKVLGRQHQLL